MQVGSVRAIDAAGNIDADPRIEELVAIGTDERDPWMACMIHSMEETEVPQELRTVLQAAFFRTADWMRNQNT